MTPQKPPLQIAIDGPVASGKGEIARRLAQKLQVTYVPTGAMYRALALACIKRRVSCHDEKNVLNILGRISIDVAASQKTGEFPYRILLDNEDVTARIQSPDAAAGASDVGTIPQVRAWMVRRQKEMSQGRPVVMEGRDIALRVLPEAQLKIYLTASQKERARRRFVQFQKEGVAKTLDETLADIQLRDLQDSTRETDPLQKVEGAWELDSTSMSVDEVVDAIIQKLKRLNLL